MRSPSRSGLLGHILNPLHIILLLGVCFSVALLLVRIPVTRASVMDSCFGS